MDPFIAQIILFGGNFAPRGWAFCDGQLLPISSNTALFSILGTMYGGDGRTTFALPDLRGCVPIHPGDGPGLSSYRLGQRGGVEQVTLNQTQIPSHNHILGPTTNITIATVDNSSTTNETDNGENVLGTSGSMPEIYRENSGSTDKLGGVSLNGSTLNQGGSQAHTNMQPYNCINYIIALQGIYPSRS